MLNHWLNFVESTILEYVRNLNAQQLGKQVIFHTPDFTPQLSNNCIALIGLDATEADAIRKSLYALGNHISPKKIYDLGNMRKTDAGFVAPLLNDIIQGDTTLLLLGNSTAHLKTCVSFFKSARKTINVSVIESHIELAKIEGKEKVWEQILTENNIFHCSVVGFQSHFHSEDVNDFFEKKNYELVRLGKTRQNLEDTEPILRDADIVSFHISALKFIEAPAQNALSPSGYTIEEACQLARYAGMSDKLQCFTLLGFDVNKIGTELTASGIAQILWYFIEGFVNRKKDYPISAAHNQLTQYVVDVAAFSDQVTFWRSNKSGRWWMEVPLKSRKKTERHKLIPCSYNDYLMACQDDLPDRLLSAYRRFI